MATDLENQTDPAKFEEELAAVAQEDEQRLASTRQLEQQYALHLAEENNRQRQVAKTASPIKETAKKELEKAAKKVTKSWLKRFFASQLFWPIVGFFGVMLAISLLVIVFIITLDYTCNQKGVKGWVIRTISTVAEFTGYTTEDVCKEFNLLNPESNSVQQPNTAVPAPAIGSDLVPISGVPVDPSTSDPRLRPCMLQHVQIIYANAQALGIDFVITSAYRAGAIVAGTSTLSAHARGEAVDIAIRPTGDFRTDPVFAKKIDRLVGLSEQEGFIEPQGDTLDEYRRPTEGATGGHIHIEFNLVQDGSNYSYCDIAT